MQTRTPHTDAAHNHWTPVDDTPFEIWQASGTTIAVHPVLGELPAIAFDCHTPVQVSLTTAAIRSSRQEYGVRAYPNTNPAPHSSPHVRVAADTESYVYPALAGLADAHAQAERINTLAVGPEAHRQRIRHAEVVGRTRWTYADGTEYAGPWQPPAKPAEGE